MTSVAARPGPLALASLLALLLVPAAGARERPAPVEVDRVRLAMPAGGQGALLVAVRYPIELTGRRLALRVSLRRPGGGKAGSWSLTGRYRGGGIRPAAERRRAFTFVHRIDLGPRLTRRLRRAPGARPRVDVRARGMLDVDRDGAAEVDSRDREVLPLPRAYAGPRLCATVPQRRARPGGRIGTRLPVCGRGAAWRIAAGPRRGAARIRADMLVYRPRQGFRGTDAILLRGRLPGGRAVVSPVQVRVARAASPVVRAIGDSVTAGFGYYDDGSLMPFDSLLSCKPAETFYNDACSSNSTNRTNSVRKVNYAPDYGLSNNVSWVAQWANEHGVTDYANLAVSGSEPANWTAGGQLYATTRRVEAEDPDYILMTMGANPLLSDMLFGVDNMGCAIWSDLFGRYRECVEEAFASVRLNANLERLYRELVDNTDATVYLMQYHLSVPSSALAYSSTQIAMMGALLNERIASVAAAVSPRLRVVSPPHFDVGIDISPVYPADYSCSRLDFRVDGQSVQSVPTQDELRVDHPLSFCPGPAEGPPWVISGDTGIHPSVAGYARMASRLPPPG